MEPTVRTAIVLQGGGALGAYEYGVLQELYAARGPQFQPAVITGISIGAINAAILAGAAQPIATLDRVWREGFAVLAPLPPPLSPLAGSFLPRCSSNASRCWGMRACTAYARNTS